MTETRTGYTTRDVTTLTAEQLLEEALQSGYDSGYHSAILERHHTLDIIGNAFDNLFGRHQRDVDRRNACFAEIKRRLAAADALAAARLQLLWNVEGIMENTGTSDDEKYDAIRAELKNEVMQMTGEDEEIIVTQATIEDLVQKLTTARNWLDYLDLPPEDEHYDRLHQDIREFDEALEDWRYRQILKQDDDFGEKEDTKEVEAFCPKCGFLRAGHIADQCPSSEEEATKIAKIPF